MSTTTLPPLVAVSEPTINQMSSDGDGVKLQFEWVQDTRVQVEIELNAIHNPQHSKRLPVSAPDQVGNINLKKFD